MDPQEARTIAAPGKPADDPDFGKEDEHAWGTLTTTTAFSGAQQGLDEATGLHVGKYPSLPGSYKEYYENVVDAVRGKAEVKVTPEIARDGLKVIEFARQSHEEGRTISWS